MRATETFSLHTDLAQIDAGIHKAKQQQQALSTSCNTAPPIINSSLIREISAAKRRSRSMIDILIEKAITVAVFRVGVAILSCVYNEINQILEWFGLVWWLYKSDAYVSNLLKALK
jgi:hypothetical protein